MEPRSERNTQDRVVTMFSRAVADGGLGYRYLGNWSKRQDNQPIEVALLKKNLRDRGYSQTLIDAAVMQLQRAADTTGEKLYHVNMKTYQALRYGVKVQVAAGENHQTVHFIDWKHPERNDFALAEEVTLDRGQAKRRPDVVLYINGIAVCVIELKRCSVGVGEGIRQLISNQKDDANKQFFPAMQLVMAGSDTQGLWYGTTGTQEKFFVQWKEEGEQAGGESGELAAGVMLDRPLMQMCDKARLLDWLYDFVIYDGGQKKVPRPHQYFGAKAAQAKIRKREGGVIWHTQGSGKSILMVLLAKWLMEHDPEARVLIVTDRDELDRQIEGVMRNAGVIGETAPSPRVTSRKEFEQKLGDTQPRLMCALIHKFSTKDLDGDPPAVHGRFYVFVDECHRTQGANMNKQMKRWLDKAIFVGFTGTPLLKDDRKTTREVFGANIHTYKFYEAVRDGVVLDLKYEARTVPQQLSSRKAIDDWFAMKTRSLNKYQAAILRKHWATMENLMSAAERKQRIIADIIQDFTFKPRLNDNKGTAILVTSSIYDACHYYRLFQNTSFGRHCGIITSFEPSHAAISRQPENGDERYKFDTYKNHVLKDGQTTKAYEDGIKQKFIHEPSECKLLIVVSKLLTGFDAPTCSYIYLDQELKDHNLFQAICRTNRLDGEDKSYGHIVDYKELFGGVQEALAVYNSEELDTGEDGDEDNTITIDNWLTDGKEKLDVAREALKYLCADVKAPGQVEQYVRYFCGDEDDPAGLDNTEVLRISYYKASAVFMRAYAAISNDLIDAGYSSDEAEALHREAVFYAEMRDAIKLVSGEELNIRPYEEDMRHLINSYVHAEPSRTMGNMGDLSLVELIVETGIHDAIAKKLNEKCKQSQRSVAEAIINNIRKTIIRGQLTDPKFYEKMSKLLDDLIVLKRNGADAYEQFLLSAEQLVRDIASKSDGVVHPSMLNGHHEAIALYNNLATIQSDTFACPEDDQARAELAMEIDRVMREEVPAKFLGDEVKERQVRSALYPLLGKDRKATLAIFDIIKHQEGYA